VADVLDQGLVEDHDEHLHRREAALVLVGEVGDAVQRDGRLAGARAALDQHDAGVRLGDQVELLLVDERGDLLEVLVGARLVVVAVDAELTGGDPRRAADAALEQGLRRADGVVPAAAAVAHEGPLRGRHPAELGVHHADRAADEHAALEAAGVELLLVLVLLLVAVVEARDWGVAPVDDRQAVAVVEEGALADQDVALTPGDRASRRRRWPKYGELRVDRGRSRPWPRVRLSAATWCICSISDAWSSSFASAIASRSSSICASEVFDLLRGLSASRLEAT
jgi:hypothetical protein